MLRVDVTDANRLETLKAAIQEGLDSGPSDKTVTTIMEEVEARFPSDGRPQAVAEGSRRSRRPCESWRDAQILTFAFYSSILWVVFFLD